MAFPTIPTSGAGRVLSVLATSPSGTHTSPSLSSLTKSSGDLLIAIVVTYDGNSTNAEFSSWGGGFTEFGDFATTTTMGIGCAYKWSDGTETGTFTVTSADTSTNDSAFILLSIPGAHASTPPEAGSRASGTTGAADPASFNPSGWGAEDTLWIAVAGSGETSTTGSYTGVASAPANYGNYYQTGNSADAAGAVEAAVAFRQLNAASEDVGTFSVDVSNARNAAIVIAVRPAESPQPASLEHTRAQGTPQAVKILEGPKGLTRIAGAQLPLLLAQYGAATRALGSPEVEVVVVTELEPAGLEHSRAQGTPQVNRSVVPSGLEHTRAQGDPRTSPQVLPAGQEHTRAQGTPSIQVQLTPSGLEHTRAQGTPTVNSTIVGTGLSHSRAQGDPKTSPQVLPAGLEHTRAQGSPTASFSLTVTVTGLEHSRAQGTPMVHPTFLPEALEHTRAQGSPQVNPSIAMAGLDHSKALGTITVGTFTILEPSGLEHTRQQGDFTISPNPTGLTHTRALGTPTMLMWVTPDGLSHSRAQGDFTANLQVLLTGIEHTRAQGEPVTSTTGGADEFSRRPRARRTR